MKETDSSLYRREYHEGLASQWDELMGWMDREKTEGPFLIDVLETSGAKRVLDAAAGTGFHSVVLANAGFDVVAIDGAEEMVARAKANIRERTGGKIPCKVGDWLRPETLPDGIFDAVICLGNSLAHLFTQEDLDQTLSNFRNVLHEGGTVVVDHRNYDGIIAGRYPAKRRHIAVRALTLRSTSPSSTRTLSTLPSLCWR